MVKVCNRREEEEEGGRRRGRKEMVGVGESLGLR